jgi:hypothetical protein
MKREVDLRVFLWSGRGGCGFGGQFPIARIHVKTICDVAQ